jgi:hypothetical protein
VSLVEYKSVVLLWYCIKYMSNFHLMLYLMKKINKVLSDSDDFFRLKMLEHRIIDQPVLQLMLCATI